MVPGIMHEVAGCSPEPVDVILHGYQRYSVRGEQYPGIIKEAGGRVPGVLYREVPPEALQRLDLFEGSMYDRLHVPVLHELDGERIEAMAYVIKPEYQYMLSENLWDFDRFLKEGRELFEEQYCGYNELNTK